MGYHKKIHTRLRTTEVGTAAGDDVMGTSRVYCSCLQTKRMEKSGELGDFWRPAAGLSANGERED